MYHAIISEHQYTYRINSTSDGQEHSKIPLSSLEFYLQPWSTLETTIPRETPVQIHE